jgi:hypothetical protein
MRLTALGKVPPGVVPNQRARGSGADENAPWRESADVEGSEDGLSREEPP